MLVITMGYPMTWPLTGPRWNFTLDSWPMVESATISTDPVSSERINEKVVNKWISTLRGQPKMCQSSQVDTGGHVWLPYNPGFEICLHSNILTIPNCFKREATFFTLGIGPGYKAKCVAGSWDSEFISHSWQIPKYVPCRISEKP